jgi:hypothetical protein
MLYFFNFHADGETINDPTGERFSHPELAKEHALQVVYELSRNQPDSLTRINEILSVVNETGAVVCEIPLAPVGEDVAATGAANAWRASYHRKVSRRRV